MSFKQWFKSKQSKQSKPKVTKINPFFCCCGNCFPPEKLTEEEIAEIKAILKKAKEKERL